MTHAAPLTLRTMTDLVEVVPALLGFHPTDSLVAVAIERGSIVVTARSDLPDDGTPPASAALAPVWARFPDADLVLIAYTPEPGRGWWALEELDAALPPRTARSLALADGDRWYLSADEDGTPYDALGSVHLARAAWQGRAVRGSRRELEALVEPARTPAEVTGSLQRVADRAEGLGDLVRDALALVEAHDDAPGELDLDDATLLCLASHDEGFLDAAMLSTTAGNAERRASLWLQVVRSSVPNCAGAALASLGLAAWLSGDGALLSVCLEAGERRPVPALWWGLLERVCVEAVQPSGWPEWRDRILAGRADAASA